MFRVAGRACPGSLGRLCFVWLGRCVPVPWEHCFSCVCVCGGGGGQCVPLPWEDCVPCVSDGVSMCLEKTVIPVAGSVCRSALGSLCSLWLGRYVPVPWEDCVP